MQVTASHILVDSLEKANDLKTKITNGADFGQLAMTESKCPSGKSGGNLGAFTRGQMVKPFEDASFNAPIGTVTDPVQTQFGYHLILRTA